MKASLVTVKPPLALAPGVSVTGLLVNEKGCCGTRTEGAHLWNWRELLFASPG